MINLETFSLGKQLITVNRFIGSYTNGVYTRTLDTSFTTWASAQPWTTIQPDEVLNAAKGAYPIRVLLVYTTVELFLDDRNNPSTKPADEVVVLGKKWEPIKVDNWNHLNMNHYRVILAEFDGY
jgi:hypothetical protein